MIEFVAVLCSHQVTSSLHRYNEGLLDITGSSVVMVGKPCQLFKDLSKGHGTIRSIFFFYGLTCMNLAGYILLDLDWVLHCRIVSLFTLAGHKWRLSEHNPKY